MTIHTTQIEASAGKCNPDAGDTINDLDFPTAERTGKAFASLQLAFAKSGHTLHRSDPADGPVTYWAERWGLVRYLPTLHEAAQFLKQIGGRCGV